VENVTTQKGANTIAVNKLTHHLYLPTASFEQAEVGQKAKIVQGSFVILEMDNQE